VLADGFSQYSPQFLKCSVNPEVQSLKSLYPQRTKDSRTKRSIPKHAGQAMVDHPAILRKRVSLENSQAAWTKEREHTCGKPRKTVKSWLPCRESKQ